MYMLTPIQQTGFTPLLRAAESGCVEMVTLLLDRGADIDIETGCVRACAHVLGQLARPCRVCAACHSVLSLRRARSVGRHSW